MLTKLTKVLVTALVLSTTSVALIGSASALSYAEQSQFDRATNGGAGHHTGDTNGF